VTPTHIITANAGDSRALLCRSGLNVVRHHSTSLE
jgi:serine/threonine protein phosphatase PrpC